MRFAGYKKLHFPSHACSIVYIT
uniref:Uncharacterized protein n=1 Tax=Arundo donax TaxID=35708 RepID=A0A0A8YW11_ARUDO